MQLDKGLIHIYTGDGKGKTTAGLGLCLRAAGSGMKVLIARFLKTNDSAELSALEHFSNVRLIANEKSFGFSKRWINDPETKNLAEEYYSQMLDAAIQTVKEWDPDVLMLDEIMASIRLNVVDPEKLLSFLQNKPAHLEVILTGRDPVPELIEIADYVSEIKKIKHPFDEGIIARKGIEY